MCVCVSVSVCVFVCVGSHRSAINTCCCVSVCLCLYVSLCVCSHRSAINTCCCVSVSVSVSVCVFVCVFSQNGNTSLHVAAAEGHLDVVRYLLSSGLDANLQNKVCYNNIFMLPRPTIDVLWPSIRPYIVCPSVVCCWSTYTCSA